jgi:S1-C subfamily serine protease
VWQTTIGDDVIALGYPLGIRSLRNDYPIAKVGYLASQPGEEVSIPFPVINRANETTEQTINGKFLVVDGLIVPGNSGGPVVLVGGTRISRNPQTGSLQYLTEPVKNMVIGVVSCLLGPSGLSVVVSSDYVIDLMDAAHNPAVRGGAN